MREKSLLLIGFCLLISTAYSKPKVASFEDLQLTWVFRELIFYEYNYAASISNPKYTLVGQPKKSNTLRLNLKLCNYIQGDLYKYQNSFRSSNLHTTHMYCGQSFDTLEKFYYKITSIPFEIIRDGNNLIFKNSLGLVHFENNF